MNTFANNDAIHIALAFCDPKGTYCRHAAVVMASIFANTSSKVCAHIIHDDTLTKNNREKLEKIADTHRQTVEFVNVENMLDSNKVDVSKLTADGERGTLFRLLIPDVLDVNKLIYLDCDIVVTMDIAELWHIDMGDYAIAAVRDTVSLNYINGQRIAWRARQVWSLLGVIAGEYFNAGVIVMNLKKFREDYNFLDAVTEFYAKYKKCITFADQDCLNHIFANDKILIDEKYNRIDSSHVDEDSLAGYIWHMAGEKPWVAYTRPYVDDLYWRYLRLTPYCNDENTLINLMLKDLGSSGYVHFHSSDCMKRLKKQLADNIFRAHVLTVPHILYRKIVERKNEHRRNSPRT